MKINSVKYPFRNLFLLVQGQFVTNLGNHLYDVAMLLWIKELTGSAALMGLAMLVSGLPEAVLAPIGGAIADRYGKIRTMVTADVISGLVLFIVLGVVLALDQPAGKVAALIVANLVLGLCAACFIPSATSLMPSLAPAERLEKANAAQQFAGVGGSLAGQATGGLVFSGFGAPWAVALNAVSFLLSALSESFIRTNDRPSPNAEQRERIMRATGKSLANVWRDPGLRRLIIGIAAFHFCLSSLPVLLPFLAEYRLSLGGRWLGFLYASYTGGIMLGFVLAGVTAGRTRNRHLIIASAASVVGVLFFLAGTASSFWAAAPALVGIGAGIGMIVVNLMTLLQLAARDSERGRIMGAAQAVGGSTLPIGMALFGLLLDAFSRLGLPKSDATSYLLVFCGTAAILVGIFMVKNAGRTKDE